MKLRRAMVAMATTAVIAPLALLSAPGAFAEDGDTASPSASSSETGSSASPSDTVSPSASDSASETPSDTASPSQSDDSANGLSGEQSPSSSSSESSTSTPSADEGKDDEEDAFDPYEDCKSFELDEKLSATIEGLPNKIVAGSGWHDFEFVVENDSDADLKNVYIDGFVEYDDETDASWSRTSPSSRSRKTASGPTASRTTTRTRTARRSTSRVPSSRCSTHWRRTAPRPSSCG